jgi:hypothetical protein
MMSFAFYSHHYYPKHIHDPGNAHNANSKFNSGLLLGPYLVPCKLSALCTKKSCTIHPLELQVSHQSKIKQVHLDLYILILRFPVWRRENKNVAHISPNSHIGISSLLKLFVTKTD